MWESSSKHPEKGEWGEGSAVNLFAAQAHEGLRLGPQSLLLGLPRPGSHWPAKRKMVSSGSVRLCLRKTCDSVLWLPHTRAQGSAPMHTQAYIPPTHTSRKDGRNQS